MSSKVVADRLFGVSVYVCVRVCQVCEHMCVSACKHTDIFTPFRRAWNLVIGLFPNV